MGDIYFNGTALAAGKKVKFNGTDMSNVYFNGTKIWTYYIPSAQSYTSSATYNINAAETSIQYKASGGGGGGGGNQCKNGTAPGGAGGDTTLSFQKADGTVVNTVTASGGAGGAVGGNNCGGNDKDFSIPSGWSNPPWSSTISDGGRGGGGEENCIAGCEGDAGGTASGTYTIPTSGDIPTKIVITIGGGGAGDRLGEGYNSDAGQAGAAWILGVL